MKKILGVLANLAVLVFLASLISTKASAISISNVSVQTPSVRMYEKYEVRFDVATHAKYPLFQYDTAPPPGVSAGTGVTVEGVFTSPSGKVFRQPAFYMTETVRNGTGTSMYFTETNKKYWVVRFSPLEQGNYSLTLSAQDASGTTSNSVGFFQASAPTRDGFIRVSQQDKRYFEFSNGKIFWPIGPAWGNDYAKYLNTGQNLERPWMGGFGAYSTNWARWKSSGEAHGNEGIMTRLNWKVGKQNDPAVNYELAYEIFYGISYKNLNAHRMWLTTWMDDMFGARLVAGKKYSVKLTYKTANIAGRRVSSAPFGFVVRTSDYAPWGDPGPDQFDSSMRSTAGTQTIINHITTNDNFKTVTTTFTPTANRENIYFYLDNVTAGQAYVYEFSMKECLDATCTTLGGEVIRNPTADMHTYVEQRPAAFFDWQVEQGEQNGVFFKYVVMDKNDWIPNHLLSNGSWADNGNGYYQDDKYFTGSTDTKARWLVRQWYRYIVARWGYSTAVHSLELNNEGPPNDDPAGSKTSPHWRTAQAFAKYLHQIYPSRYILATTSFWCCWRPDFWGNRNGTFPDVDYADVHEYTGNPQLAPSTNYTYDTAAWINIMAEQIVGDNVGKPTLLGENGLSSPGGWNPIPELNSPNSGIWYHNMLWAGLARGALFAPNYWFSEHLNQINREQTSKPFYTFVKDLDLNKGGFAEAAATLTNSKLRVYGQKKSDGTKAYLWIQNSDHTWQKVMQGVNTSQSGTVTLTLAANKSYSVERWNTYTGTKTTQTQTSDSAGKLAISITSLTDDTAVKVISTSLPNPTPTSNTPSVTSAQTPTPTGSPTAAKLKFKVRLPDISASTTNISAANVQVELRDGAASVGMVGVDMVRNGNYFQTSSEASFNISQNKAYTLLVKTKLSLRQVFAGVNLTQSQTLDCTVVSNTACGELISQRDNKPLLSGDSDGFNTASGSYNKIDSADLQMLAVYFNKSAIGPASSADFNLDSAVNISDLEILGKNYGSGSPPDSTITPPPLSTPTRTPTPVSPTTGPSSTPIPPGASSEWTQLAHDSQRTSYTPEQLGSNWSFKWIWNGNIANHTFYSFRVQPVTGNGKVYLGLLNGQLLAINESSGSEAWRFQADSAIQNTAAYDPGTGSVFFASEGNPNGTVYRLSTGGQSPTVLASRQLNGKIYTAILLVNNTVYIGTTSGFVYALDKNNLSIKWSKNLGAVIMASTAYSISRNIVIAEAENMNVYALNADNGSFAWANPAYLGGDNRVSFNFSYPVVADIAQAVIVRTDVRQDGNYACNLLHGSHPANTLDGIRDQIRNNRQLETFFVLNLSDGQKKYGDSPVPVMYAAAEDNWNSGCLGRQIPPQAMVKKISVSEEVAYVTWRNGLVSVWPREDATFGEMSFTNGDIRFVKVDSGVMRLATDEISWMSMAGDILFHYNWQAAGAQKVDRTKGSGTFSDPLQAQGLYPALNSLWSGDSCASRIDHYCPNDLPAPPDCPPGCNSMYLFRGPGFFMHTSPRFSALSPPQSLGFGRDTSVVISNKSVYIKARDGTIMALSTR